MALRVFLFSFFTVNAFHLPCLMKCCFYVFFFFLRLRHIANILHGPGVNNARLYPKVSIYLYKTRAYLIV